MKRNTPPPLFVTLARWTALLLLSFTTLPVLPSFGAVPLMVSGYAGMVGQYTFETVPLEETIDTIRVPIGLLLQAHPSDNTSIYLGLDYAYNNYPAPSVLLGNTSDSLDDGDDETGTGVPLPFANSIHGTTPYSQKTDVPTLTQAYFTYQTPVGLFKAGRMPRNWGMGLWLSSEWTPYSGIISTSDAVSFVADLGLFDVSAYYERYGSDVSGFSGDDSATGLTLEARLKTDPADPPSSGISREIGLLYSKVTQGVSDTDLNIIDIYAEFYFSQFFLGFEGLYNSGSSKSPNYQTLGGAMACPTTAPGEVEGSRTCTPQDISAFMGLLKVRSLIGGNKTDSLAAIEKSQATLGTNKRIVSHVAGLWAGYAGGGSNQFAPTDSLNSDNSITAIAMNPNVQPAFLMFNNALPPVSGMPMGLITNATFVRADYTFEHPSFGSIQPAFVWGMLNKTNENYNAENLLCTAGEVNLDPESSVNKACVGGSRDLGFELDVAYRYTTLDRVTFGADIGYWLVGDAWKEFDDSSTKGNYGVRVAVSTQF